MLARHWRRALAAAIGDMLIRYSVSATFGWHPHVDLKEFYCPGCCAD
jgi:hypothetical protein